MNLEELLQYGENFHYLYSKSLEVRRIQLENKMKLKCKSSEAKLDNLKKKLDDSTSLAAHFELKPNASKFAIYSAIRAAVLEADTRYVLFESDKLPDKGSVSNCCSICTSACKRDNLLECFCHANRRKARIDAESGAELATEDAGKNATLPRIPQIVGAGLRSLFELIAESKNIQPTLCMKALKALFDVIEGQLPESFKNEPEDIIKPLYELLLDLATAHSTIISDKSGFDNWSSISCSALIGLCVARGDTGKILRTIAALLMSSKLLPLQFIKLPHVVISLQKSVIAAVLNKSVRPQFYTHGVPQNSLIDEFNLETVLQNRKNYLGSPTMTTDGKYLYLLAAGSLFKIGTGFDGTCKGHVYVMNTEFSKDANAWLGFCSGKLYYKPLSKRNSDSIFIVNTKTLSIQNTAAIKFPNMREKQSFLLFSDGELINVLCTNKDDSLVIKQFGDITENKFELPLKLARKRFRILGYAAFEDEVLNQNQIQKIQSSYNMFEPKFSSGVEVENIVCGKEFGIVRAADGKVYYYGRPSALGLKSVGKTPTMKMTELVISKLSNIVQISMGHDGIHALLVNEDGTVYFTGTAKRGEDGDTFKNRRQLKAVKPKKISRINGHYIVQAACNNGTSAFVTKTGKLIIFGKDTAHCDSLGFVTNLLDQHISKVALGKAHCVALNSKGQLFTFGLNNKGQCGRKSSKEKDFNLAESDRSNQTKKQIDFSVLCDFDDHAISQGQCRVCTVCKECTGYNVSCVFALNVPVEERVSGAFCLCGTGDAGCSKCGACSSCISGQEMEMGDSKDTKHINIFNRERCKYTTFHRREKKSEENNPSDVERDPPRVSSLPPQKVCLPSRSPVVQISCGLHHTVVLTLAGEVFTFGSNQYGQLGIGDLQPVVGPVQVKVSGAISQVSAGSNHTVLLTSKGMVYTFGNYQKGQLGRLPNDCHKGTKNLDDTTDEKRNIKRWCTDDADEQRQKFFWNCTPGTVFGIGPTFGKKAIWIGTGGDQTFIKIDESLITTHMLSKIKVVADKDIILLIPTSPLPFKTISINRRDGSCAAHYENQADFVGMIQKNTSLLSEINQNIHPSTGHQNITANNVHETQNQAFNQEHSSQILNSQGNQDSAQIAFTLNKVLWVFDGVSKKILCFNVIAGEISKDHPDASHFRTILHPELSIPDKAGSAVSRVHIALNLLACLDVLTSVQRSSTKSFEDKTNFHTSQMVEVHSNEYLTVNRFENFGGGWGYSGHSVEAIRFMSDTDVIICGFGMFGGRGEYSCKLKLYDLETDGGGYEKDGVLVSETKEISYECPARSKYNVMLPKPIHAVAGRWYLVWSLIAGPSSDCGSSGQSSVTTENQIVFTFKSSKKANNGTDVNSGQIPSIIYKLVSTDKESTTVLNDIEPVYKVTKGFANTITKECLDSLIKLLSWAWEAFKTNLKEYHNTRSVEARNSLLNIVSINKFCLRLLRKYTNDIYLQCQKSQNNLVDNVFQSVHDYESCVQTSSKRMINLEDSSLIQYIVFTRDKFVQIFCDDTYAEISTGDGVEFAVEIFEECHTSFIHCFDAFYPTSKLKWDLLCDLLSQMDKDILHSRLLSATLAGLYNSSVNLKLTFSLQTFGSEQRSVLNTADYLNAPVFGNIDNQQYHLSSAENATHFPQEKDDLFNNTWTFKDVLVRLLDIISKPVRDRIDNIFTKSSRNLNELQHRNINQSLIDNCCHLISRVLAEIVYQTPAGGSNMPRMLPRGLHSTGSRFAKCDASRTWNTGNFGPDAISFTVDRPGIAIAGAVAYSGSGSYDYQLELLCDNTTDSQAQNKWETLESVSGCYDQDSVQNDMIEIKFDRPVHIRENVKYAIRLCSQGARTCSGESGFTSIRGPCGTSFCFYPCDLSFNGTTVTRGQIPSILYYSSTSNENYISSQTNEVMARDTALEIATDIMKKCIELLVFARNALAVSLSPSDKSTNSSNHTQIIDSEHNITPIEEHMDITMSNNSWSSISKDTNISATREITKKIESFSKGIIETLKFDKKSTNPFDFEIEIGATEIFPKELIEGGGGGGESQERECKFSNDRRINGNESTDNQDIRRYLRDIEKNDSEDNVEITIFQLLDLFNSKLSNIFHNLLPLVCAYMGTLANNDPKSSVHILSLIREILPHIAALNQLYAAKVASLENNDFAESKKLLGLNENNPEKKDCVTTNIICTTTSNHYCIIESEHPYKSTSINTFRIEFPSCVQWLTIEFDPQCGTAQLEDYLLLSIPAKPAKNIIHNKYCNSSINGLHSGRCYSFKHKNITSEEKIQSNENNGLETDWITIKKFNTPSQWCQDALILPGNKVELSLETASLYSADPNATKYGFKCLVIGYDNPSSGNGRNSTLALIEHELAYLGGMCSATLMKNELNLPGDNDIDLSGMEEILSKHHSLLSKGLALSNSSLTINQALEPFLPIGSQSTERQFLKDFIAGAPGSSGGRLAAWLQPEPRLDPNKCELTSLTEPVRQGWPTQLTVLIKDQYGDPIIVPELKVEIRAIPVGLDINNGNKKLRHTLLSDLNSLPDVTPLPKMRYEPTTKEKMCFKAITFMKPYSQYSFEELRLYSPAKSRKTEILFPQDMDDGTFTISWTPNSVGSYCLTVIIDGVVLEEICRTEVKEGGLPPPQASELRKSQPPSKLRQFIGKYSAGLRIRSHPTLQSDQVGILENNGIITFIDEIENDDGTWVRLSTESIRQHCVTGWYPTQAWCLQYNQHIAKTLLYPVENQSYKTIQFQSLEGMSPRNDLENFPLVEGAIRGELPTKHHLNFSAREFSELHSSYSTNPFTLPLNYVSKSDKPSTLENDVDLKQSDMAGLQNNARKKLTSQDISNISSGVSSVVKTQKLSHCSGNVNKSQTSRKCYWSNNDVDEELQNKGKLSTDFASVQYSNTSDSNNKVEYGNNTNRNQDILQGYSSSVSRHISTSCQEHKDYLCSNSVYSTKNCFDEESIEGCFNDNSLLPKGKSKPLKKKNHFSCGPENVEVNFPDSPTKNNEDSFADKNIGPPKVAMPPSLAESLRAVFAAFLWHEGIVHDAMACSSFLKFHPTLTKEGAIMIPRRDECKSSLSLSREQKAQQRHSVEMANASNYLNIKLSTLETLKRCGNISVNRRCRKNNENEKYSQDAQSCPFPEVIAALPPALKCLVFLWEQLSSKCLKIVQSTSSKTQVLSPKSTLNPKETPQVIKKEHRKQRKKLKDDGSWCELCEVFLPIPVTYHMRIIHPGCGRSSKGKGYNSVGIFCEGWAGDCGEGGKGASSWFLMCSNCRKKYISQSRNLSNKTNSPEDAMSSKTSYLVPNSEVCKTMRDNAVFLLELTSCSTDIKGSERVSVVANHLSLLNDAKLNINHSDSIGNFNKDIKSGLKANNNHSPFGPDSVGLPYGIINQFNTDSTWPAPNNFSCLESLGVSASGSELPHEIFDLNSAKNCFEKPISELPFDLYEPINSGSLTSTVSSTTNVSSRFHRSFSMGQGWVGHQGLESKALLVLNDQPSKVVFRRRNNINNHTSSSLLCYPSENLRKLVPNDILNTTFNLKTAISIAKVSEDVPCNEKSAKFEASSSKSSRQIGNFNANSSVKENLKRDENSSEENGIESFKMGDENVSSCCLLSRPVMSFILQKYDLEKLRHSMKRSLRKATCRTYSLQALNWLLRSVTQAISLHDLMWWFVSSLKPIDHDKELKFEDNESALEHPITATQMIGRTSHILSESLHSLLQSVSDLTLLLPAGSSLQRMAIQCFGIKFNHADHQFLHNSHVFGNISKILTRSDEQNEIFPASNGAITTDSDSYLLESNPLEYINNSEVKLNFYMDMNGMFEITVSSRQEMADSLTDNSTETFWESDEEDRNKCKVLEISIHNLDFVCKFLFVHIDNSRDIQNKVLNIVFFGGQSLADIQVIKTVDVDSKACTWISARVWDESYTYFRLEFRGPEGTLRVRQIKLLGVPNVFQAFPLLPKLKQNTENALQIQQKLCEAETLRVFRLITGQVFGKLISMEGNLFNEDSLDLQEHMVGILFSRSKLSHLQKQVIVHIVHAIRREAKRAKDEWEIMNTTYSTKDVNIEFDQKYNRDEKHLFSDNYCFEMLNMVLALSGSSVGRSYISHQHGLLKDLLSLLHTGSDRVQRQVTALIRRILPEICPTDLGKLLGVQKLPPNEFSIITHGVLNFDMNRLGILDIFLSVIAKSLQLQVKVKTATKPNMGKSPIFVRMHNCIDFSIHPNEPNMQKEKVSYDVESKLNAPTTNSFAVFEPQRRDQYSVIKQSISEISKTSNDVAMENLNQRWFMKGVISMKQADNIISLMKDMSEGKLTEKWSLITKTAIAESILNLTRLDEIFRSPEYCVKTATFWLALASLCVLDEEHVEKLSSGQWSKISDSRPFCDNHDDGETLAVILCDICGSLCGDCDRFLHLSRKSYNHKRTVCKEEEEAIRVELHESCGRTRLFWLLALVDSKTLKGVVEFRNGNNMIVTGSQGTVGLCRFCGISGNSGLLEIGDVCADPVCQDHAANSCSKIKLCGHPCGGVLNELKCLPCLHQSCSKRENEMAQNFKEPKLTQDADDMCMICFVEALSSAPSLQLECGHVFHYHCCKLILEKRWNGPRITFGFSLCPICKTDIHHSLLNNLLEPIQILKDDVKKKALMRLKYEGIINSPESKDLTIVAMDRYAYYVCFKCNKAYYGGEARCDAEIGEKFDPEELVCGGCSDVTRAQICPKHGTDFLEYKCRYCCSVAVFFCFGTTHFCDTCHDDFQRLTNIPKNKLPQCPVGPRAKQLLGEECPLHIVHPPTGEEFALGCGICRNAQTF